MMLDMDHRLMALLVLFWISGLQAEETLNHSESVRLVGGSSRCTGTLELKGEDEWRPVYSEQWALKDAAIICKELDCGSAISIRHVKTSLNTHYVWSARPICTWSPSAPRRCLSYDTTTVSLEITCSDSIRLVNGTSLCSGRLEVKSNQSNQSNQRWSSVCEADFDQQDAEVVCRELGCGAPSVLQGALYGEVEAPVWTKEFQCGGHESALLDCRSSGSDRNTCSPGKAVGLTCSEPVRLVGGSSRCAGTLEVKHQNEWRPVYGDHWTLKGAIAVCRELDCGSAVSVQEKETSLRLYVWRVSEYCVKSVYVLKDCVRPGVSSNILEITCSDSVRLVDGTSLCSGRLEVKSNQSNQSNQRWSSVCEADFDQQDAEVVCRELGCGAPSVLQGALYGEVEAPVWIKEFQCGGHESALLDCRSSGSDRNTCSPGKAVGLTCSEPVRLVGGSSRCAGTLEVKHQNEWRPVHDFFSVYTLKKAAVLCGALDCGSAVSTSQKYEFSYGLMWMITTEFAQSVSTLRESVISGSTRHVVHVTCSDSVRLVNGTSLCSGRLEVKSNQSNQSNQRWSSVCEADFDQQDAEVVCRELGCGAPSVLQGALYGEVEAPVWTKEFQCGGHESALLDCRSSGSDRNTCSPGKAVGLTCSEPVRLVGGSSRCAGTLEVICEDKWRPVDGDDWSLREAAVVCRRLNCGSAVSTASRIESTRRPACRITTACVHSGSTLNDCARPYSSYKVVEVTCSDSVRLVNGTSLCSGRLEVKSNQSNQSNQRWSSVCEADFDQQDAEVVCRELGCGAPSVLQGALYGEVEAPMWTKEFQCGGHESALLDCRSSGSDRNTCSPGKAVGLTCSEPVRLVGGSSRCAGTLEVKQGEWRPVDGDDWSLREAAVVCRDLDCGSPISIEQRKESTRRPAWSMTSECVHSGSALRECVTSYSSYAVQEVTCSDSVRLVNGTGLCSGRLEVKSNQSNQSNQRWSSVCEADFDQQDAEVVCRELGCGAPSVLQGALYGEVEAPMWTKEFQCGGHESALLDCRSSGSDRNTCSPGKAVGLTCSEHLRLVGGSSRCAGTLEVKHQKEWRLVDGFDWSLREAAVVCEELDCGSAVSVKREESFYRLVLAITAECVHSGSALRDCVTSRPSSTVLEVTCSDSVRLVNGTSLCSGRLEVKSNQSNQSNQRWSSVCEADFDQQDAEVVCRELGCGAPSVLQGALYGEVEAPMWTKEFQCGGHESALLDCRSSGSDRNTCSPGKAVGLTCSEPVRLFGGSNRCAGTLEVKQGEWRPVYGFGWSPKDAAVYCRELDCGSAVSAEWRKESNESLERPVWMTSQHAPFGYALKDYVTPSSSSNILVITCSDSVRLVNGTSLCSGRLEVKSNQSNQSNQRWSSVCEADFDQQDAEVVCRELGCGAPSVLQGALYGEVEAPMWTKEFQCGGHESALLDCRSSGSDRNTCSPGKAVGLTCSEPVRLVGGSSRCAGTLEMKHQNAWRPLYDSYMSLREAAQICKELDCGSAVSTDVRGESRGRTVWKTQYNCIDSGSALRDCVLQGYGFSSREITCSDSVRLVDGTSLCSGRLEVKSNQSNQSNQRWSSVCEADFDQQDAEVVCRELGCGAPSVLQGALYGEVEAPMWTKEFQCGGHESALLDCRSSGSDRNTCSPGKAVGLTCSEPVRLVGGSSRCAGTLEVKHQNAWRPLYDTYKEWTLREAALFCRELNCGSAVSMGWRNESSARPVWMMNSGCVGSGYALRDCVIPQFSFYFGVLTCSDVLVQPNISLSSMDGVSEAQQQGLQVLSGSNFTVSCSIQPQFPGGSFLLSFTSSNSTHNYNYTQPAVNHSAHFLFPAAEPAHQGSYICVYHVYVFFQNFSSESRLLSLTVSEENVTPSQRAFPPIFIFALVLLLLSLTLFFTGIYSSCKATRGQTSERQRDTEVL